MNLLYIYIYISSVLLSSTDQGTFQNYDFFPSAATRSSHSDEESICWTDATADLDDIVHSVSRLRLTILLGDVYKYNSCVFHWTQGSRFFSHLSTVSTRLTVFCEFSLFRKHFFPGFFFFMSRLCKICFFYIRGYVNRVEQITLFRKRTPSFSVCLFFFSHPH